MGSESWGSAGRVGNARSRSNGLGRGHDNHSAGDSGLRDATGARAFTLSRRTGGSGRGGRGSIRHGHGERGAGRTTVLAEGHRGSPCFSPSLGTCGGRGHGGNHRRCGGNGLSESDSSRGRSAVSADGYGSGPALGDRGGCRGQTGRRTSHASSGFGADGGRDCRCDGSESSRADISIRGNNNRRGHVRLSRRGRRSDRGEGTDGGSDRGVFTCRRSGGARSLSCAGSLRGTGGLGGAGDLRASSGTDTRRA